MQVEHSSPICDSPDLPTLRHSSCLETVALSHCFPDGHWGLRDVSVRFVGNMCSLIVGANGAGKTLLARHLDGLERPTKGQVLIDGTDIHANIADARRRIGLVFQNAENQIVGQTLIEDVAFGPRNAGLTPQDAQRRAEQVIEMLNLTHLAHRDPRTLSGGEVRLLAIAGMVALGGSMLIVDEPFTNLDWNGCKAVVVTLARLREAGHGIIVITHSPRLLAEQAEHMVVMVGGRVAAEGAPSALATNLKDWGVRPWR